MKVITTSIQTLQAKLAGGLIITLIIAGSCSDPSNIGIGLDPNNNQIGVFYAEIPLSASMVLLDSFYTTNQGSLVVGGGTSDFFGTTEGIGFSRIAINLDAPLPNNDAILDSVKFNFQIESVLGKNLSSPKSLKVHLLTEAIQDTSYYNFDRLSYSPSTIAEGTFDFSARQDTAVSVMMDGGFSEMIFQQMKSGNAFRDIFSFRNFIPGIAVTGNIEEETSLGLRVGNSTGLVVFYHNEGDTVSRAYPMSTAQSRHFNYVRSDRTGTPTGSILQRGTSYDVGPLVGSMSNLGLVLKIDTSPINEFLDTLENITFNEITFDVGPLETKDSTDIPPTFMLMYFTNETNKILNRSDGALLSVQADGQPQLAIDANGNLVPATEGPAVLAYVGASRLYRQRITSYVNAIHRSDLQRNDWLLYPNSPSSTGDDFKKSFRNYIVNKDNIKLKVYYSKIRAF